MGPVPGWRHHPIFQRLAQHLAPVERRHLEQEHVTKPMAVSHAVLTFQRRKLSSA